MSREIIFDVVFKGKFVRNLDKERAILHFSKLFKVPLEKAEKFFDGQPRTLKKDQELNKASTFRSALKKAGLKVSLVKKINENYKPELSLSAPGVTIVTEKKITPVEIQTSQFSLDEVGAQFAEKTEIQIPEFDLSNFEIDDSDSDIVEKKKIPEPKFDLDNISVEDVGSTFSEKKEIPKPQFDLTNLSFEEVGATLVKKKEKTKVQIDTDGIELCK